MGDRTWVEISTPLYFAEKAEEILKECYPEKTVGNGFISFSFNEINYGTLDEAETLIEAGIPYDYEWGPGDQYEPGKKHIRFNEKGEVEWTEYYESELNPPISALLSLIDSPDELRTFIREYASNHEYLNWDDQVENSKKFLTLKLIDAAL